MISGPVSWLNETSLFKRMRDTAAEPKAMDARIKQACAARPTMPEREKRVETRLSARFSPIERETFVTCRSGQQFLARIINISPLSVAIEADFSGADHDPIVKVGTRKVRPGRKMLTGRVFMFERPLSPSACRADIIL